MHSGRHCELLVVSIHILPLPAVRFDRLTVLSLPKEERAGVRGPIAFTLPLIPSHQGRGKIRKRTSERKRQSRGIYRDRFIL
jgi:hypothetical protein